MSCDGGDYNLDHSTEPCGGCVHEAKCTCVGRCRYYETEDEYDARLAQEAINRDDFIDWGGLDNGRI